MHATRITVDRLWRCLCPSIDGATLTRAISAPYRPLHTKSRAPGTKRTCRAGASRPRRCLHTTTRRLRDDLSADKKEEESSPSPNNDAAAKPGGQQTTHSAHDAGEQPPTGEHSSTAPRAQKSDTTAGEEEKPLAIGEQGATEAWRGYFDVVFDTGDARRRPTGTAGRDPLNDVYAERDQAQRDGVPTTGYPGQGILPTAADADNSIDIEAVFGSTYAERNDEPTVHDLGENSVPTMRDADAVQDILDGVVDANTATGPIAANVYTQNQGDLPKGKGTSWTAMDAGIVNASIDETLDETGPMGSSLGKDEIPVNDAGESSTSEDQDAPIEDASFNKIADGNAVKVSNLPRFGAKKAPSPAVVDAGSAAPLPYEPITKHHPKSDHTHNTDMVKRILSLPSPWTDIPPEADKDDILTALRRVRMNDAKRYRILAASLVKHFLAKPDVKPNPFIYDTIFRAHCLPEGSVDVVTALLKEMRELKIAWSSAAYHSVLRVLAVHPDYLLRNDMIREMKERWLELMPKGHRYIAIGLLRDEQYELALEKLEEMTSQGVEIEPWVFDIFIYVFGRLELLDDALRIARYGVNQGVEFPVNIWYFLLDVCSKAQHYEGAMYAWNRTVTQGIVNPSDGVCLNILNMAAVFGDTQLATQVIQYLSERGTRLARPHYEALADAYCMQGNIARAIEVFCIMYGAGAEVSQPSLGTLGPVLAKEPSLIDKAVEVLTELKARYKLPIAIYNTVLNEMVKSSALPADDAFLRGLDLYRRIKTFVPTGPNQDTFRILLRCCTSTDAAQFLAGEMISFGLRQDLATTELLFKVHVDSRGPLHRAKTYFYRISRHLHSSYRPGSRRWQNIMDLSVQLVKLLIAAGDPEAWRILETCKRNGLEEDKITALRDEVEAGKLAVVEDDSLLPDRFEAAFGSVHVEAGKLAVVEDDSLLPDRFEAAFESVQVKETGAGKDTSF